jgi:glycine dehydrogenase
MNGPWHQPGLAQMVGWKVVPVKSATRAAISTGRFPRQGRGGIRSTGRCMITYPSTHGVFEETVREVCEITHELAGRSISTGPT